MGGGYLWAPESNDFNFGFKDFTIEFWINRSNLVAASNSISTIFEISGTKDFSAQFENNNNYINIKNTMPLTTMAGDGANSSFSLGYTISDNDISILVDNKELFRGTDYTITNSLNDTTINLTDIPNFGSIIQINKINEQFGTVLTYGLHFISIERNQNVLYLFVDGKQLAQFDSVNEIGMVPSKLYIGANKAGFNNLVGELADLRITQAARHVNKIDYDSEISSEFTDTYLGTKPSDIIVTGGGFVDSFSSHAPEELIPGKIYDTLDMRVYSISDGDRDANGAALVYKVTRHTAKLNEFTYSYKSYWGYVDRLLVYTVSRGLQLEGSDYTVDRVNKVIIFSNLVDVGDTVIIYAYGLGGGNLLAVSSDLTLTNTNVFQLPYTHAPGDDYYYYAWINGVPTKEFVVLPVTAISGETEFDFNNNVAANTLVTVAAFEHSANYPSYMSITRANIVSNSDFIHLLEVPVTLEQNVESAVFAHINGIRLRPAVYAYLASDTSNTVPFNGDGLNTTFTLTNMLSISARSNTEVDIWINGSFQDPATYTIIDNGNSTFDVIFNRVMNVQDSIKVLTYIDYKIINYGNSIMLLDRSNLTGGDILEVIHYVNNGLITNETSTVIYKGSQLVSISLPNSFDTYAFDSTGFDDGGSVAVISLRYKIPYATSNGLDLWVTVDGVRMHEGIDFILLNSTTIEFRSDLILNSDSLIVITQISSNKISPEIGFRIFKDMIDNYTYYTISKNNSTELISDLYPTDSVIYLQDVSGLKTPIGRTRGVVFIGSERITYVNIDRNNNTISGLMRGTLGTSAKHHASGEKVVASGYDQKLPGDPHSMTWYTKTNTNPSNGLGLQASTTPIATFLLNNPTDLAIG